MTEPHRRGTSVAPHSGLHSFGAPGQASSSPNAFHDRAEAVALGVCTTIVQRSAWRSARSPAARPTHAFAPSLDTFRRDSD